MAGEVGGRLQRVSERRELRLLYKPATSPEKGEVIPRRNSKGVTGAGVGMTEEIGGRMCVIRDQQSPKEECCERTRSATRVKRRTMAHGVGTRYLHWGLIKHLQIKKTGEQTFGTKPDGIPENRGYLK